MRAALRRMAEAIAGYEPRIATLANNDKYLDQHAAQARAVLTADRQALNAVDAHAAAVTAIVAACYKDVPLFDGDDPLRQTIADEATRLLARLDELGLQLVRKAAC